jgi:DNA-binding beta-propeller fold protein YncE
MSFRIRTMAFLGFGGSVALAAAIPTTAVRSADAPLVLEAKVSLGEVRGRIDHLAIDIARYRLFVAELGNDTVAVVDLAHRAVVRTLTGLREPQGLAYEPTTDTLYVANGGDGAVQLFQGADLRPAGRIALGEDADNIRTDPISHRVVVGYGNGALAIIDPVSRNKIGDVKLKGHPESFQISADGNQAFVNVPDAHEIAAINFAEGRQTADWSQGFLLSNYPMTLGKGGAQVHIVFRHPATMAAFDAQTGKELYKIETCGDSDDVFFDSKRSRAYVSCGDGSIEVIADKGNSYASEQKLATLRGARTALFVPELDRYYLAVPATGQSPAAVWIYKPVNDENISRANRSRTGASGTNGVHQT